MLARCLQNPVTSKVSLPTHVESFPHTASTLTGDVYEGTVPRAVLDMVISIICAHICGRLCLECGKQSW